MPAAPALLGPRVFAVGHLVPAGPATGRGAMKRHAPEGVIRLFPVTPEAGPPVPAGGAAVGDDVPFGVVVRATPLPIDVPPPHHPARLRA